MTIRGRSALTRAAGFATVALLMAGCGTRTSAGAGPAPSGSTDVGRVHADPLESSPPPRYGDLDDAPLATATATAEPTGPCPDTGLRVAAGRGDAAMGLRVLDITLTNCGKGTFELYGYPKLKLLEEDRGAVERVRILEGTKEIAATGVRDDKPTRVTVRPGERAVMYLVWRNTYDDITHPPVTVEHVTVDPGLGRGTPTVTPDPPLDLGSTGRLGTTAWRKE
ncbi:DUF4232 domain-containing protein [Streptomyces sp. SID8379]|uniref:DUF4232 domain-containing protein n=1 Tax=unclassified Streptomyces TaxID=2593676 RepID=UPI00036454C5|nr:MULTISPECIES: DUF4232 domain-containing protein [unclassified Streptomyces]MYW66786.1 DUF4232 domain-containing protein [Streptomyces sp. SID8379]